MNRIRNEGINIQYPSSIVIKLTNKRVERKQKLQKIEELYGKRDRTEILSGSK